MSRLRSRSRCVVVAKGVGMPSEESVPPSGDWPLPSPPSCPPPGPEVPGVPGAVPGVSLPEGAAYYLCGPLPFMKAVRSSLIDRGVSPHDIQYEVFGPDLWRADLLTEPAPGAA